MKINRKKIFFTGIALFIFVLLYLLFSWNNATVLAETLHEEYMVKFDYENKYYIANDQGTSSSMLRTGKGKTSATMINGKKSYSDVSFVIKGDFLNYGDMTMVVADNFELKLNVGLFEVSSLIVFNDFDEIILSTNEKSIELSNLKDGVYYVEISLDGDVEIVQGNTFSYKATCCFNFRVKSPPKGEFVKSDKDNSILFVWNNDNWKATLDGQPYSQKTWITAEGNHSIELINELGIATTYNFDIDHFYIRLETIEPTCMENGYDIYKCSQCGELKYNELEAIDHQYITRIVAPTCTESGGTQYECQVCGYSYIIKNSLPSGHNYTTKLIKLPTCNTEGMRRNICDDCGYYYDTVIPANGHNYEITDTLSSQGTTSRIYTCSECGHSYKQELGDQYEEVSNYVDYLFEQYSPYMWWVLLASAGVWSIAIGVMIAIAQKNDEKEKAKKMLVNYVIGLIVIAVIVVACPYLMRGIAALIT